MRSILPSPRTSPCLLLVLALGCGDPEPEAGEDDVGDSTGTESGDSSNVPEAGSEANDANDVDDTTDTGEAGETSGSTGEGGETFGTTDESGTADTTD
jgi:hypothetical protein